MSHLPRVVPRKLRRHPSLSFFSPLNPSLRSLGSPLLLVIEAAASFRSRNDRSAKNGREAVMPVFFFHGYVARIVGISHRFWDEMEAADFWFGKGWVWTAMGKEGKTAVCEGGHEPHDVPHAPRVFLWILLNAFDHSKCRSLFMYSSLVSLDT